MNLPFDTEDLPVGIWVVRAPGGEPCYANRELTRLAGDGAALTEHFARAMAAREPVHIDELVIRHAGGSLTVRGHARPLYRDGEISHVLIALIDVTAEAEARRQRAHDFNNLLTSIRSTASRLAADESQPDRRADLETIERAASRAAELARGMVSPASRVVPASAPPSNAQPAAGNGVVLLVEDEQLVRVSTFRVLRQLGYQVIACADGDEAVEIFRERRGDIRAVMLDVAMPKMSGRQTYLALREIDSAVRVLVIAGGTHGGEVDRILELGAREFLAKPFETRALSQALARVIDA